MPRDWVLYIKDILKECENIKRFTKSISFEEFSGNIEKLYATAKAFENIGEAVKNIPTTIKNEFDSVPWHEIARMRDVLTHHYFGVDDKMLWDTLGEDLILLEKVIKEIFEKYGSEQNA